MLAKLAAEQAVRNGVKAGGAGAGRKSSGKGCDPRARSWPGHLNLLQCTIRPTQGLSEGTCVIR